MKQKYKIFFKKHSLSLSFLYVLLFHFLFFLVLSINANDNLISNSQEEYTKLIKEKKNPVRFIEVELKEFFALPTDEDIIEIVKKKIPKKIIIPPKPKEEPPLPQEIVEEATPPEEEIPDAAPQEGDSQQSAEPVLGLEFKRTYIGEVIQILANNKYYPRAERNRGREGVVKVAFTILPSGEAINISVRKKSKYPNLDAAAIETVKRSSPFPPYEEGGGKLPIVLSIDFKLDE